VTLFGRKPQTQPKKTSAQYILGVSSSADGSAAAMLRDDKVIFSAFEPPPPRGCGAAAFPSAAVSTALEKASEAEGEILGMKDLAAAAFCGKPLREYDRLRREWLGSAPGGYGRFMETAPGAFYKRRLAGGLLERELSAASWGEKPALLLYPEHQLCCAASAFFPSPFEDSAILSLDGPGEEACASVSLGSGEKIKVLRELAYPDSPQLLAGALAAYAGFGPESAWELFTAPPPAEPGRSAKFMASITGELAAIKEDGSLRLNRRYFRAAGGMQPDLARWRELFGFSARAGGPLAGAHLDFAAAARAAIEEIVFRLGAQAKRLACSNNLCLCAGTELKLAAEGKLKAAGLFSSIWSQPYSAPEGKAAGAALAARHIGLGMHRSTAYGARLAWGEAPAQPLPEESESPVKVSPARPLTAGARLYYAAYFWLSIAPKGLSRPRPAVETQGATSFYAVRSAIYTAEDLQGPG
jgi:carbamoyltransferase